MESLPSANDMLQYFEIFYLFSGKSGKPLTFPTMTRYTLSVVALLEACDVTTFLVTILAAIRIRNPVKTARIGHFLCLTCRITHK